MIDGELVAQREDPELQGGSRSEAGAERGDEGEKDCLHVDSKLPHLFGTRRESPACAHAPRSPVMASLRYSRDGQARYDGATRTRCRVSPSSSIR